MVWRLSIILPHKRAIGESTEQELETQALPFEWATSVPPLSSNAIRRKMLSSLHIWLAYWNRDIPNRFRKLTPAIMALSLVNGITSGLKMAK
jgi:hypothetical protein